MIRAIMILLLSASSVFAGNVKYWEITIPTIDGATNVSSERDERFYTISSSHNVEIKDTKEIYNFYNDFFEKLGWEDPTKKFPKSGNQYQGKWSSYRSAFNDKGLPESTYASMWKGRNIPAIGVVNLKLTSYKNGKFAATVDVTISPEVDTSPLFQLQELMIGDPKNIFILHKATGGNLFEIDKINPQPSKDYRDNEMVKEYYALIETIYKQYRDFWAKYVQH